MRNFIVFSATCFGLDRVGESGGEAASLSLIVMFMYGLDTIKLRDNIRNDS